MPDKKLTDRRFKPCKSCLHYESCITANYDMVKKTFECEHFEDKDLINRLQAENERLSKENIALNRRAIPSSGHIFKVGNALLFAENKEDYDITINAIKAEAYKEFDECLKEDCLSYPLGKDDLTMLVDVNSYNNLLKELVGEE